MSVRLRGLMRAVEVWRWLLGSAVVLVMLAGPAQSWGRTGAVSLLCLTAVALAAIAVPLGLLSLRSPEPDPRPSLEELHAIRRARSAVPSGVSRQARPTRPTHPSHPTFELEEVLR